MEKLWCHYGLISKTSPKLSLLDVVTVYFIKKMVTVFMVVQSNIGNCLTNFKTNAETFRICLKK